MRTVTILIGNSDNKLTQEMWSAFCSALEQEIAEAQSRIHFSGYSLPNKPWQNACWVIEVVETEWIILRAELSRLARLYLQSEIAILVGETEMVKP